MSVETNTHLPHEVEGLPPAGQHFPENIPSSEIQSKHDVFDNTSVEHRLNSVSFAEHRR